MPWSAPLLAVIGISLAMSPVSLSEQLRQMSETVAPSVGSWEKVVAVPPQGGPEAQRLHLAGGSDEAALLYGSFADD